MTDPFDRRFTGEFIYQLGLRGRPKFGDGDWLISLRLAAVLEPCTTPLFTELSLPGSRLPAGEESKPVRLYPTGVNLSASVRSASDLWWQARTSAERAILHVY